MLPPEIGESPRRRRSSGLFFHVFHLYVLKAGYLVACALLGPNRGEYLSVPNLGAPWLLAAALAIPLYHPTRGFARWKRRRRGLAWLRCFQPSHTKGRRRNGANGSAATETKKPRFPWGEPGPRSVCVSDVGLPRAGSRRRVCAGGPYEDATSAEPLP